MMRRGGGVGGGGGEGVSDSTVLFLFKTGWSYNSTTGAQRSFYFLHQDSKSTKSRSEGRRASFCFSLTLFSCTGNTKRSKAGRARLGGSKEVQTHE